jgi:hypothetical protein
MKKTFFVILFALFTVPAMGQGAQTFVHDFGDYKIYHKVGNIRGADSFLISAKIKDRDCKELKVSPVKITDNAIVFIRGTEDTAWKLEEKENGVLFKFPNGVEKVYKPTDFKPLKLCRPGRGT